MLARNFVQIYIFAPLRMSLAAIYCNSWILKWQYGGAVIFFFTQWSLMVLQPIGLKKLFPQRPQCENKLLQNC